MVIWSQKQLMKCPNACLCLHVDGVRVSTGQIGEMPDNSYLATRQECFHDDCGQGGLN